MFIYTIVDFAIVRSIISDQLSCRWAFEFMSYFLEISFVKIWTAFSILVTSTLVCNVVCSISQLGRLARTGLAPAVTVNTGMLRYLLLCYSSLHLTAQCTSPPQI